MLSRRRCYLGEGAGDNDGNGGANDDTGDDDAEWMMMIFTLLMCVTYDLEADDDYDDCDDGL